ncbi:MAG: branched-chain amino acid ABC transporter permease [Desulfobacterales bacterium]|nr:branched-chain amino acid ABC transporter permease [Desulfobacterales bacterium]MBF0398678.1 branched-chain amino acid ABC transporter permease [Desulfobacterales bacterium]
MFDFVQMLVSGIASGSAYALMGLAMVIIYKTSKIPNFAQGEMALAPSFFAYMLIDSYHLPFYIACILTFGFSVFLGCMIEIIVLRKAQKSNVLGMIIITIGLEMILLGFVSWKFGAEPKSMPFPISPYDSIPMKDLIKGTDLIIGTLELFTFTIALILMIIIFLFFKFTKFGIAMKATQQNQVIARAMGINTRRIQMMTWAISSFVGCIAGLLVSSITLHPYMMWDPMLKGFSAAVLGGMASLPGSIIGAYIIGILESLFGGYISIEFKSVVSLMIIVVVLCIKPSGLFARHYIKKV